MHHQFQSYTQLCTSNGMKKKVVSTKQIQNAVEKTITTSSKCCAKTNYHK